MNRRCFRRGAPFLLSGPLGDSDTFTGSCALRVQNRVTRITKIAHIYYILRVAWAIFVFWIALRPLTGAKAPIFEPRLTKKQISSHQSGSILKWSALKEIGPVGGNDRARISTWERGEKTEGQKPFIGSRGAGGLKNRVC